MSEQTNNKKIAKNTVFLYFRMMFTMLVSLYTSRVILDKLGLDDYGVYQAVGGIVTFLSFINGALGGGTSRFLTYALGKNDFDKLKMTFSTTLTIHIVLAIVILLVAEIGGWWFLHEKMVIASDRLDAAEWVFQLSLISAFFMLTQVPYGATIIAHERMDVYAYMSIVEVSIKLAIVYALSITDYDRLIVYSVLLCLTTIGIQVFYRIYCGRKFLETHYNPYLYDKKLLKEIGQFSGWQLFAQGTMALNSQGILLLLNQFFTPTVVAARAISLQVNSVVSQFVVNFRTAANPQIVKKYAASDFEGSKNLLLSSTKYSYYLMWIISLPVFLLAEPLLNFWLKEVPDYTVIFLQLIIIQSLLQVFDTSFYTALYAKGRLKENALLSPTLSLIRFPIVYLLFSYGFDPVCLSWASLVTYAVLGLIIKPFLLVKIVDYDIAGILNVFRFCFLVTLVSLPLPVFSCFYLDKTTPIGFMSIGLICALSVGGSVWFIGLDRSLKQKLISIISKKIASCK